MTRSMLSAVCGGAFLALAATVSLAADDQTAGMSRIAVFDFELEDTSAGGGIIPQDHYDTTYLAQSTAEAKRLLAETGRYVVVATTNADLDAAGKFGLRNCGGCEAGLAQKLGADQAMTGVITRINRTEYTLVIRILDARSGAEISTSYTNLRMGANYAWPRGVKWLMENQVLAHKADK